MSKRKMRSISVIVLLLVFVFTSTVMSFAASGTKTMTAYNEVIVKGNYAYCSASNGIYKVNIKTGSKKRIVKEDSVGDFVINSMKIHNGYLYYKIVYGMPALYRVKLSGKSKKHLADIYKNYVISGNKIYYRDLESEKKMRMDLNGKHKKKSSVKFKMKEKKSNKKGYWIKDVYGEEVIDYNDYYEDPDESPSYLTTQKITDILHKPNGKEIKLFTYTLEYYK